MSFLWDSLYSVFARTRNYLVDLPGEENLQNPELAITGEGRGATAFSNRNFGKCHWRVDSLILPNVT